ncbi:MAG TPA: iron ABC transporter permease [Chloroflexi bacterium]|nr:MAG: hypothetical protein B6243_07270 [Anaerolineaceae bacterium 4572_5.2]HEY84549.1 iron ABC transporter permease [Chloroflexota bacterium]
MLNSKFLKLTFYALPLAFFALFYFYPLAAIFGLSFAPEKHLDLSALAKLTDTPYYLKTLWFTIWQATLSTLLTLLLAMPGAYVFARYRFWSKNTLKTLSTLPFVLPTVVVANAFTALLGPRGLLNQGMMSLFNLSQPPVQIHHTIWMILLAHIFYNYSVALRIISGYWQNLNPNVEEAAQLLGASPIKVFRRVTLPLLMPAINAAGMLVFIFCFSSFGVVLILGGPQYATLEVEIYRQAVNLFNLPTAAALSIIQIIFTFGLMRVYSRSQTQMARPLNRQSSRSLQRPVKSWRDRLIVVGNLALMLLLLGTPLLALVLRSFSGANGLTLRYYRELFINRQGSLFFVPPAEAIFNSIAFALATVVLAALLGMISALLLTRETHRWRGWLDALFMLPLATSAVTLGFGYIIALGRPPLNLRSSLLLVPVAHTLIAIPFVIRSLLPAMRSINPKLREAAATLGATPRRAWLAVDWPLIQRALLVGAVFAFTISMGEFGATLFIARPQTPTMPVAIYRFLGQPGALNYGQALAMSALLMLVCAIGFIAIERFQLGDEGEF